MLAVDHWEQVSGSLGLAVGHWEQVPGSLGGCPGAIRCADSLIFADLLVTFPWVNLRIWSGCNSWQSQFGSQFQFEMVLLEHF